MGWFNKKSGPQTRQDSENKVNRECTLNRSLNALTADVDKVWDIADHALNVDRFQASGIDEHYATPPRASWRTEHPSVRFALRGVGSMGENMQLQADSTQSDLRGATDLVMRNGSLSMKDPQGVFATDRSFMDKHAMPMLQAIEQAGLQIERQKRRAGAPLLDGSVAGPVDVTPEPPAPIQPDRSRSYYDDF